MPRIPHALPRSPAPSRTKQFDSHNADQLQAVEIPINRREATDTPGDGSAKPPFPRWLRTVMAFDRTGTLWYIGASLLFAPILAALSPWPTITAILWGFIGLAGLYLGLLGIAMAAGLAGVMKSGSEMPEECWRFMVRPAALLAEKLNP